MLLVADGMVRKCRNRNTLRLFNYLMTLSGTQSMYRRLTPLEWFMKRPNPNKSF